MLGIDIDEAAVGDMADVLQEAVIADARDEKALREAGINGCDVAVIAIGEDLEANIVAAMNVKVIGVKEIWAKAMTRTHHRILSRLGVDRVIHVEREIGQRIAEMLHNPLVRDYVSVGNGFYVVTMVVSEDMDGQVHLVARSRRALRSSLSRNHARQQVGADRRRRSDARRPEDRLLVLGKRDRLREFSDSL